MSRGAEGRSTASSHGDKYATKDLKTDDDVKKFIQSVSSKKEGQLLKCIAELSISASDRCVAYITKRQNQGKSSNKEKQIKKFVEDHSVRTIYIIRLCTISLGSVLLIY